MAYDTSARDCENGLPFSKVMSVARSLRLASSSDCNRWMMAIRAEREVCTAHEWNADLASMKAAMVWKVEASCTVCMGSALKGLQTWRGFGVAVEVMNRPLIKEDDCNRLGWRRHDLAVLEWRWRMSD